MTTRKRYRRLVLAALLLVALGMGFSLFAAVQNVRHAAMRSADL
jgi:hypothetical protein